MRWAPPRPRRPPTPRRRRAAPAPRPSGCCCGSASRWLCARGSADARAAPHAQAGPALDPGYASAPFHAQPQPGMGLAEHAAPYFAAHMGAASLANGAARAGTGADWLSRPGMALGADAGAPRAQPKKPAVPNWLRAEMLKRGLTAGGAGDPAPCLPGPLPPLGCAGACRGAVRMPIALCGRAARCAVPAGGTHYWAPAVQTARAPAWAPGGAQRARSARTCSV